MDIKIPQNLKMVVFDLDETLQHNKTEHLPQYVRDILQAFVEKDVPIALVSLNPSALLYLKLHKIMHLFTDVECRKHKKNLTNADEIIEYVCVTKNRMFERIMHRQKLKPENILFFDDNVHNILEARAMKIKCVRVNPINLVRWRDVYLGLSMFNEGRQRRYSLDY